MTTIALFRAPTGLKWTNPAGEQAHLVSAGAENRSEAKTACGKVMGVSYAGKEPSPTTSGVCQSCLSAVANR